MTNYSIAVVIPAYNAQAYIGEALDSVSTQSRRPEQIIIVDDGSSDDTAERIREWERQYNGELHLLQQSNQGVSAARNTGIRYAKTDLVALLDADDVFLPHHLEQLERAFKNHPQILLCFGDALYFDSQGMTRSSSFVGTRLETVQYSEHEDGLRLMQGSAYVSLLWGSYIAPSASLFSKSAVERVGLFDEAIRSAEDRDLWLRLSRTGSFAYYPLVVARKRVHENNLTHLRYVTQTQRYQLSVLQKMIAYAEELQLSPAERQQTREATAEQIRNMLYTASRKGLRHYCEACVYLARQGVIFPLCNPKHLLRALISLRREERDGKDRFISCCLCWW